MHPSRPARPSLAAPLLTLLLAVLPAAAALASDHAPAAEARPAKAAKAAKADKAGGDDQPASRLAAAAPTLPAGNANANTNASAGDPMEQLRQRLAERLAATKVSTTGGQEDVRVMAKAAPSASAMDKLARSAGQRASGHGSTGAKAGDKSGDKPGAAADLHPAHWDYNGAGGPQSWGALKPEFSLCSSGQRQSPIDIRGGLAVDLDPVRFDYQASRFAVVDNGHTVQVNLAAGNTIDIGGKRFELKQFHFHRPSEERIDGRQFEMSVHLVHKDDEGRLAVVTVLLEKGQGQSQPVVQKVWNNLPLERNTELASRAPLELADLLPADRRYYTYMGSLTTPPCSEGVQWVVLRQPVTVTPEQIEIFARIYPMNARPIQAAAGRRIMQSN